MRFLPLVVAVLIVACGGSGLSATERPQSMPSPTFEPEPLPEEVGITSICTDEVGPLADALMELDSRLAIGMPFAEYSERVADAQVVYDRIDLPMLALDQACLNDIAVPAEAALTNYVYAYRVWNACVDKPSCTLDDIESKLQGYWAKATVQIDEFRFVMR